MLWGCQVDPDKAPILKALQPNEGETLNPAPLQSQVSTQHQDSVMGNAKDQLAWEHWGGNWSER